MDNQNPPFSANVKQQGLGVLIVFLLIGAMLGFQLGRWSNNYEREMSVSPTQKACTKDAKVCPDGSTVVRSGPNCEFAPCSDFIPPPSPTKTTGDCTVAGCSGQLCVSSSEGDVVTTCEMKEEYNCLQYSKCEKQSTGKCGWTETSEYSSCLNGLIR